MESVYVDQPLNPVQHIRLNYGNNTWINLKKTSQFITFQKPKVCKLNQFWCWSCCKIYKHKTVDENAKQISNYMDYTSLHWLWMKSDKPKIIMETPPFE